MSVDIFCTPFFTESPKSGSKYSFSSDYDSQTCVRVIKRPRMALLVLQ